MSPPRLRLSFFFIGYTFFILQCFFAIIRADCDFTCPQGHQKYPSGHQPKVNGCGVQGLNFNSVQFPAFTDICNEHDRCYGRCGATKNDCDKEFSRAMKKYCESQQTKSGKESVYRDCTGLASLYSAGVEALGCSFYKAAQEQACTCTRSKSL